MGYRITVIGGGSSIFTPQLIALLIRSAPLAGSTLCLMDINPQRLELMDALSRHIVRSAGADLEIESTTDRLQALTAADFVITTVAVGGFDAWEQDIEIPARYGVYQPIGDTVGPGGLMRALRHVPLMVEVGQTLERVAPGAQVLNYTNPATALCLAVHEHSRVKVASLCTNTVYLRDEKFLAGWAGVRPGELTSPPPAAGINHCAGLLELRFKDGRDAFPLVLARSKNPVVRWGLEVQNFLPYAWPHWQEFYPSMCKLEGTYSGRLQGLAMSYGHPVHDMNQERARVARWEELLAAWRAGEAEVSASTLPRTERMQIVEVIEALVEDRKEVHVVNVPNLGAIDNMPADSVVEVSASISGEGIQPLPVGPLPAGIAVWLRLYADVQRLTVEAALAGDRRIALQALELDPLAAATLTLENASRLLDEMLTAQAAHLPRFQ